MRFHRPRSHLSQSHLEQTSRSQAYGSQAYGSQAYRSPARLSILVFFLVSLAFFHMGLPGLNHATGNPATGKMTARVWAAPAAQPGEENGETINIPVVLKDQAPPIAEIRYAVDGDYAPLAGNIIPTDTFTMQIELQPGLATVTVLQAYSGGEAEDITAAFPALADGPLEGGGTITASLTITPGDYLFTVRGQRMGATRRVNAAALVLPPDLAVLTSEKRFPLADGTTPEGTEFEYESNVVVLSFDYSATPEQIADFLRDWNLYPLDWLSGLYLMRAEIANPNFDAPELVELLNNLDSPLLEDALLNRLADLRDATGERMPMPLTNAHQAAGNGDCSAAGNVWEGCIAHVAGSDTTAARVFRYHFFLDTFAGQRLVQHLLPNNPAPVGLAVIDTGLGNGAIPGGGANTNADIPAANLFGFSAAPYRCSPAGVDRQFGGAPKTLVHVRDPSGHGTSVAAAAAARGVQVLGTGLDVNVRPMRHNVPTYNPNPLVTDISAVLECAGRDANVHVLNASWGVVDPSAGLRRAMLRAVQYFTRSFQDRNGNGTHDTGEPFVDTNGNGMYDAEDARIMVAAVANDGRNWGTRSIPDGFAPDTLNNARTATDLLFMAVSNSQTQDPMRGPEQLRHTSSFGQLTSVAAPGGQAILPDQNGTLAPRSGASFAAPVVAGLLAEMRMLDRNTEISATQRVPLLQLIEMVEATADDLGTTEARNSTVRPNDRPGNGNDNYFGNGRVNVWKAILALINGGVAQESHANLSTRFPSLTAINAQNTDWYGFKIHAPVYGATVWIDGVQVRDANATAPGAANLNAYAGVRMDRTIRVGIHSEDPTSGVVPLGSNSNFLLTFSIERADLVKAGGARVLQLRRPGETADDAPFFNLELDLADMRAGNVPGVVFDDFVFEVTPPDFGDAAATPITLADNGAHHRHYQMEYFGRLAATSSLDAVSAEHNVPDFTDVDGVPNWGIDMVDQDGKDDGITLYPLTYKPGGTGRADVRVCVKEPGARYVPGNDPDERDKQLYVNAWFDWNTSGSWEAGNEHVLDGMRLAPDAGTPAGWAVRSTTAQHKATVNLLSSNANCAEYSVEFPVPVMGTGRLESRWRLDYGENVGRHANTTFTSTTTLSMTRGAAYYGEVEDYVIGPDFGDAGPDGPWPTSLGSNGPRHLSYYREWIGPYNSGDPTASREPDGCNTNGGDQDGADNIGTDCSDEDNDNLDNFSVTIPEEGKVQVVFEVTAAVESFGFNGGNDGAQTLQPSCELGAIAATPATPEHQRMHMRYDAGDPTERLYVNLYADWDGDGTFEADLLSAPMDPEDWGGNGAYTLGEPFVDANDDGVWNPGENFTDVAGELTRQVTCIFDAPVPPPPNIKQWVRLRLDYGENVGAQTRSEDPFEEIPQHQGAEELGGVVWGEVEDAPLTGPPVKLATPEAPMCVPPGETIAYAIEFIANPELTGTGEATVVDALSEYVDFQEITSCSLDSCAYSPSGHTVTASGAIQPNEVHTVQFEVTVSPERIPLDWPDIVNTATVFDGVVTHDVVATTEVCCVPIKRSSTALVQPGEIFRYTLALPGNPELEAPSDAGIQDQLPEILQFAGNLTCSVDGVCSYDEALHTVFWQGTLAPEEQVIVEFDVQVPEFVECTPTTTTIVNEAFYFDGEDEGVMQTTVQLTCPR